MSGVLASARRRATRDGDRQVDTAHLLHSLLEADPCSREALDAGGPGRVARVLAYLAQRSIGYGLRWSGMVEDSGAVPVVRADAGPGWSPAAGAALRLARERAAARGADAAEGADLLAAFAADPGCRAVQVLRAAGVDPVPVAAEAACDRGYWGDGPVVG
nr:Clp protease N-terminal domain-containing protein [Streptomyces sp. ICBB 8177]